MMVIEMVMMVIMMMEEASTNHKRVNTSSARFLQVTT